MNDPSVENIPMPVREVKAIRLMIYDETKDMTPAQLKDHYDGFTCVKSSPFTRMTGLLRAYLSVGHYVICPRNDAAASSHMPSPPSLRAQLRFVC